MATKTLGLGLFLVLAAGGGYFLLRSDPADQPAPVNGTGSGTDTGQTTPPEIEPRSAEVKFLADSNTVPREDRFLLPDGSWARALNGVKNAPFMDWPRDIPWSPIVERIVDQTGQEWYKHADGSMSTTLMTWRSDLNRYDPVTQVANPTAPAPREIDVGPTLPDSGRKQ